ncbi:M24 family metallopeptidase [Halosolutus halophilus]|uniref:M24 family metallopeptidase n=1 Tax=Halosolutus halophilus TaxID=1552990 RepID=UPI0022352E2E|nr:Xaa-Pro peptidase family protein [Halosolutus halophilus]
MSSVLGARVSALQRRLDEQDADLAVCFPGPNLTYLTGFDDSPSERHLLLFVPRTGAPTLVAPELYEQQLRACPIDDLRVWADEDDPLDVLATVVSDLDIGGVQATGRSTEPTPADTATVLVDDRMWATFTHDLRDVLPAATFDLLSTAIEALRIRKDDVELDALRRSASIADRVSVEIRSRGTGLIGTSETALAAEIEDLLEAYGGDDTAFDTIVASGPNAALPHHHSGPREIEAGDPVVLDFGTYVDADVDGGTGRYPSDQTRTIVAGDPSAAYERVHEVVREAQSAAIDAIEPGVTAGEIDRAARSVIADAGYGDAFVHRTGHGVGLEVHEPPYIVADSERELEPGTVFSVEPGVYLPEEFGVRIEDLVVVTADGVERLNDSPRGWETGAQFRDRNS